MKNLPERNFWNEISGRLSNYSEDPADDAWDKISGALPPSPVSPIPSSSSGKKIGGAILLIAVSFTAGYFMRENHQSWAAMSLMLRDSNAEAATSSSVVRVPKPVDSKENSNAVAKENEGLSPKRKQSMSNADSNAQRSAESKNSARRSPNSSSRTRTNRIVSRLKSTGVNRSRYNKQDDNGKSKEQSVVGDKPVPMLNTSISTTPEQAKAPGEESSSSQKQIDVQKDSLETPMMESSLEDQSPATTKQSTREKKIIHTAFYMTLSPMLAFHKISPLQNDNVHVVGLQSPGVISKQRFGLCFEIGIQRQLMRNLEMFAGLSYYQQDQTIRYNYIDPNIVDVTDSQQGSFTISPRTATKSFDYKMFNAGFATGAFYRIKGDNLMHKIGVGVQYQHGLLKSAAENSYHNAQSSYIQYQLMYRLEMPVTPKLNFYLQPVFNHVVWSTEKLSEPFTIKPSRAGIGFGAVYRF